VATLLLSRTIWKKWSGNHSRGLVENKMRCFKMLGERFIGRNFDGQAAELQIRAATLKRFTRLGTPTTVAVTMQQFRLGFGELQSWLIYTTKPLSEQKCVDQCSCGFQESIRIPPSPPKKQKAPVTELFPLAPAGDAWDRRAAHTWAAFFKSPV
jgi:hypothetical protein